MSTGALTPAAEPQAEGPGMAAEPPRTLRRRLLDSPVIVTFGALLAIIIVFSIKASGQFDTTANFRQLAQNVAILTVVSVGTTFVIATAGVDLSIPSGIVLGEVFAVKFLHLISVGSGTAVDIDGDQTKTWYILFALCGSLLAGLALGLVTASPSATCGSRPCSRPWERSGGPRHRPAAAERRQHGDLRARPGVWRPCNPEVPNLITIAALAVIGSAVLLNYSVFGRHTLAIGSNEEAARRVGIKVERHLLKVYMLGGAMSGLAGFLSVSYFTTTSVSGHSTDNLHAITAVAIGGTSLFGGVATIIGSVIGVWIPAVLQNGFVIVGVQPYWQDVAVGFVLILAVWGDQVRRGGRSRR